MSNLPEECEATAEHAKVHLQDALDCLDDPDQVKHNLYIMHDIAVNLQSLADEMAGPLQKIVDGLLHQTNKTDLDDQLDHLADQFCGWFADEVQQARAALAKYDEAKS